MSISARPIAVALVLSAPSHGGEGAHAQRSAASRPAQGLAVAPASSGSTAVIAGAPTRKGSGSVQLRSGRDGALLREITAPAGSFRFGAAVSALGDVDADGRSDLQVGAPGGARAHLLSGASGGVIATVEQPGGEFGASIAGVNELDGDGVREFNVGAPSLQGGQAWSPDAR